MQRSMRILTLVAAAVSLAAHLAAAPAAAAPTSAAAKAEAPAAPVDVNAAGIDQLTAVPGIGKSLAQRIVSFREKNGAFAKVDDLLKVQGIGEKSLEKLRPFLTAGRAAK